MAEMARPPGDPPAADRDLGSQGLEPTEGQAQPQVNVPTLKPTTTSVPKARHGEDVQGAGASHRADRAGEAGERTGVAMEDPGAQTLNQW
ncbi:MAG: hypothetical protein MZW92_61635 [Comamonadaceae bacterium]|nr:hypothetical protein [Comamonadaceae bacterium]